MASASTARKVCTKCGVGRALSSYTSERGRVCAPCRKATRQKAHRVQRVAVYGITVAEYEAILAEQDGGCGGCGREPRRNEKFDVDHDHEKERAGLPPRGCVRGLLCRACNRKVLPYARNNPETLRRLAAYLDFPPAWRVLK